MSHISNELIQGYKPIAKLSHGQNIQFVTAVYFDDLKPRN